MGIENCPLSQIPPDIVNGGPSLVIQVCTFKYLMLLHIIIVLMHILSGMISNNKRFRGADNEMNVYDIECKPQSLCYSL